MFVSVGVIGKKSWTKLLILYSLLNKKIASSTFSIETLRMQGLWMNGFKSDLKNKTNSVVLVRKRTVPTERSPHVGEVSANF
jgi:hypothetical protein